MERLLATAGAVFDTYGYTRATVDLITAEARVSTGTFYRYFRDKRQLLLVLVGEALDLLAEPLSILDLSRDPLSAIEGLIREMLASGETWRAWREASAHDVELAVHDRKIAAWVQAELVAAMERVGDCAGLRPDRDRAATARVIILLLWQLSDETAIVPEPVVRAAVHMVHHALFVDGTRFLGEGGQSL